MEVRDAFSLIARAIDAGTAANGYLVVGGVRGNAAELADLILRKLFPDALAQIEGKCHPDVVTLEPEGKSRTIHVGSMRWQRETIVGSTASGASVRRRYIVFGVGSSSDFRNAFAAASSIRSAPTTTPTFQPPEKAVTDIGSIRFSRIDPT